MTNETPSNDMSQTQPSSVSEPQTDQTSQTQPNNISDTQPRQVGNKKPGRSGVWISVLIVLAAIVLGSLAGYGKGVAERIDAKNTLVSKQLGAQFQLVQQDMDAGRYSVARQRLEYIIGQDPNYSGAAEKLAEVLVKQAITPSPVPTDTPTITPTPDMRSQQAIFAQAQQQLNAKDWTGLMGSLDSLRKADPSFEVATVDSMYFTALRNRGVDQILGVNAYKTSNLEGGIYDLTIAERFGPLDGYADGLRSFARLYIIGASYWDLDWAQAVNYFRQVTQYAPNLRDSSNVTSSQRLYQALLKYGDQLSAAGKLKDRCVALDNWDEASRIAQLDATYNQKYNQLYLECYPPTATPTEIPTGAPIVPTEAATAPAPAPTVSITATP